MRNVRKIRKKNNNNNERARSTGKTVGAVIRLELWLEGLKK
jgi:hypothetical protein